MTNWLDLLAWLEENALWLVLLMFAVGMVATIAGAIWYLKYAECVGRGFSRFYCA